MLRRMRVVALAFTAVSLLTLTPRTAAASRTIAIAYFDNNTGSAEYDPLRKGLADMLITDLGNVAELQIVERDKLNQVLAELKLSKSRFIDPATAQKLGKGLAAEFIMTGGYALGGDELRIDARVVEVATGRVAASEKVVGPTGTFFSLEKDLVDVLIKALNVKLSAGEKGKLRSNATESFDAWQKYSAGLDARDRGDEAQARRLFQAALAADPGYRAARTAAERLDAVIGQAERSQDSAADKEVAAAVAEMLATFDLRSPDLMKTLETTFKSSFSGRTESIRFAKRVAFLIFVAEHDLKPPPFALFSEENKIYYVSEAALDVAGHLIDAPDGLEMVAPAGEYFISQAPADKRTLERWKDIADRMKRAAAARSPEERAAAWQARLQRPGEFNHTFARLIPDIRKMYHLYARKVGQHR